jgi:hypothetical protein
MPSSKKPESKKPGAWQAPTWRQPDGQPVSCIEKLKVLNENLDEIRQMAQDALEDAVLMGCDEKQVRDVFAELLASLENPYRGRKT